MTRQPAGSRQAPDWPCPPDRHHSPSPGFAFADLTSPSSCPPPGQSPRLASLPHGSGIGAGQHFIGAPLSDFQTGPRQLRVRPSAPGASFSVTGLRALPRFQVSRSRSPGGRCLAHSRNSSTQCHTWHIVGTYQIAGLIDYVLVSP